MEKVIHRSSERGRGEHGWLKTRYSFSFADWYEPTRMGFGALRVINDDVISPSSGFPRHSHRDMEIITIVTKGAITHTDSMGNTKTVPAGDVQIMSAGTGVEHAEHNASPTETLELFQIWIEPKERGVPPRYAQKSFKYADGEMGLTELIAPGDSRGESLTITQDAYISYGVVDENTPITYLLHRYENGVYVFVIDGAVMVAEERLGSRDAVGIWETESVIISATQKAQTLCIEVPMQGV